MNDVELKKAFGDDYPAAVVISGVRMPLAKETTFTRYYHSGEPNTGGQTISRFMDGSASMTLGEFQRGWASWTDEQRTDFCGACAWLQGQSDFPEMLRYIMQRGTPSHWSGIAQFVASELPVEEAFLFLRSALQSSNIGEGSNLTQAIAITKHANAEDTLRRHLETVLRHPTIWNDADFSNPVAFDAATCISNLIELGASPSDFEDHVRGLSRHVCPRNRSSCRTFLSKFFLWLN